MNFLDIDRKLFFLINQGTSNALFDVVMPFLTRWGFLLLLPYFLYLFVIGYRERKSGGGSIRLQVLLQALLASCCSFLLADWISNEIKHAIGRIRPCNILDGVRLLVGCTQSYSLPSNHASNSFAAVIPLFYFTRSYVSRAGGAYLFILASLVSFSRPYVGVHYPSDIIAGALLGSIVSLVVISFFSFTGRKYRIKPYTAILFAGLTAISIFRIYYILHGPLDLSPDEAHYWEWSRRLDLSYYSKGPVIAYLIYLGTSLFGDTVFGIRILAVILSALSSVYLFKLVNRMYCSQNGASQGLPCETLPGLVSGLLLQAIPLFAPFGVIFSIDSPFIFFWTVSLYIFWKALASAMPEGHARVPKSNYGIWALLGVAVGLGLLTKYTMAFFYVSGFLFLILPGNRPLLKTGKPYLALLVSMAVFSPVIIWNMQHEWVTLHHTAGQAHVAEGITFTLKNFLEFFGSQVGVITPLLFVLMFYSLFKLRTIDKGNRYIFLLCFTLPILVFFLLKSIQGKVQVNWAMTGYITGIIAFCRYFFRGGEAQTVPSSKRYAIVFISIFVALFLTMISHYPTIIKLPHRLDPSARLRGWQELGTEVSGVYAFLAERGNVLIFSDSYQASSELAFYVKGHPRTYSVNLGRRMNQYDLWPDMNSDALRLKREQPGEINGIFVRISDTDMPPAIARAFDRYEKRLIKVYDKAGLLREYSLFICYNFKGLQLPKPGTF